MEFLVELVIDIPKRIQISDGGLPFADWMKVPVTALEFHPNDPAASAVSRAAAGLGKPALRARHRGPDSAARARPDLATKVWIRAFSSDLVP